MPRAQGSSTVLPLSKLSSWRTCWKNQQELATKISTAAEELTAVREEMAAALAVEKAGKDAARTSLEAEKAARAIEQEHHQDAASLRREMDDSIEY